jgi:hypothetical protein
MHQFSSRFEQPEKVRGQSMDEINRATRQIIESESA